MEGARGEKGKERREAKGGDKSPAWSSQNLGSTVCEQSLTTIGVDIKEP